MSLKKILRNSTEVCNTERDTIRHGCEEWGIELQCGTIC